eukprot:359219-Chlamydomonas_euryale.AAC.18
MKDTEYSAKIVPLWAGEDRRLLIAAVHEPSPVDGRLELGQLQHSMILSVLPTMMLTSGCCSQQHVHKLVLKLRLDVNALLAVQKPGRAVQTLAELCQAVWVKQGLHGSEVGRALQPHQQTRVL